MEYEKAKGATTAVKDTRLRGQGLDYLRRAGVEPDQRVAEAIDLVEKKRDGDGRWPLENPHAGEVRWNTLRAVRVLDWYSARVASEV